MAGWGQRWHTASSAELGKPHVRLMYRIQLSADVAASLSGNQEKCVIHNFRPLHTTLQGRPPRRLPQRDLAQSSLGPRCTSCRLPTSQTSSHRCPRHSRLPHVYQSRDAGSKTITFRLSKRSTRFRSVSTSKNTTCGKLVCTSPLEIISVSILLALIHRKSYFAAAYIR